MSVNTSIFTLIAIALDRYRAIMKPFGKRSTRACAMVCKKHTTCEFPEKSKRIDPLQTIRSAAAVSFLQR